MDGPRGGEHFSPHTEPLKQRLKSVRSRLREASRSTLEKGRDLRDRVRGRQEKPAGALSTDGDDDAESTSAILPHTPLSETFADETSLREPVPQADEPQVIPAGETPREPKLNEVITITDVEDPGALIDQVNSALSGRHESDASFEIGSGALATWIEGSALPHGAQFQDVNVHFTPSGDLLVNTDVIAGGGTSHVNLTLQAIDGELIVAGNEVTRSALRHRPFLATIQSALNSTDSAVRHSLNSQIEPGWEVGAIQIKDGKLVVDFQKTPTSLPPLRRETHQSPISEDTRQDGQPSRARGRQRTRRFSRSQEEEVVDDAAVQEAKRFTLGRPRNLPEAFAHLSTEQLLGKIDLRPADIEGLSPRVVEAAVAQAKLHKLEEVRNRPGSADTIRFAQGDVDDMYHALVLRLSEDGKIPPVPGTTREGTPRQNHRETRQTEPFRPLTPEIAPNELDLDELIGQIGIDPFELVDRSNVEQIEFITRHAQGLRDTLGDAPEITELENIRWRVRLGMELQSRLETGYIGNHALYEVYSNVVLPTRSPAELIEDLNIDPAELVGKKTYFDIYDVFRKGLRQEEAAYEALPDGDARRKASSELDRKALVQNELANRILDGHLSDIDIEALFHPKARDIARVLSVEPTTSAPPDHESWSGIPNITLEPESFMLRYLNIDNPDEFGLTYSGLEAINKALTEKATGDSYIDAARERYAVELRRRIFSLNRPREAIIALPPNTRLVDTSEQYLCEALGIPENSLVGNIEQIRRLASEAVLNKLPDVSDTGIHHFDWLDYMYAEEAYSEVVRRLSEGTLSS